MAKISRRLLAKTAVRLLGEQPQNGAHIARSLAAYLVVHKQTHQLDALMQDMSRELLAGEGALHATVESAFGLDAKTRREVENYLQSATGAQTIELTETVKPELLSGIVLRTADQELNLSAQYKLKQLASYLLKI